MLSLAPLDLALRRFATVSEDVYSGRVGRLLDFARRTAILTLAFGLGFFALIFATAALTRPDIGAWMPLALALWYSFILGFMAPLSDAVIRISVTGLFGAGAVAAWFLSEPPALSEPNQRLTLLVPLLALSAPAIGGILVALLTEERRAVPRKIWLPLALNLFAGWALVYFSGFHRDFTVGAPQFMVDSAGNLVSLGHRAEGFRWGFVAVASATAWWVAYVAEAGFARRLLVSVGLAFGYAIFNMFRVGATAFAHPSRLHMALDFSVCLSVAAICECITKIRRNSR